VEQDVVTELVEGRLVALTGFEVGEEEPAQRGGARVGLDRECLLFPGSRGSRYPIPRKASTRHIASFIFSTPVGWLVP